MKLQELKAAPDEAPQFEPLPEGNYPVTVLDASPKTASTGTEGVGMKLEVAEGKHKGRYVYDDLWLTPKAKWRVKMVLGALGFDLDAMEDDVPESALIGRRAVVLVRHEDYVGHDGVAKTRVKVQEWGEHPDGPGESREVPSGPKPEDDVPF